MPAAPDQSPRRCLSPGPRRPARRGVGACAALLAVAGLLGGCASTPGAGDAEPYRGSWAYAQSCGLQHSARLDIEIAQDGSVGGEWSDGTRLGGESGRLAGRMRAGRLDLRLCTGPDACPPPSVPADAHLRREGPGVVWYRRSGGGSGSDASARDERYLSLHPVVGDADPPLASDCSDGMEPAR